VAAGAARGDRAEAGAGTEPGGNRRSDRRRPGNGEIAPALRDGQAARAARLGGGGMSRREHEPLSREERDLARGLSRLDPHAAPSAELDAAILAAARAQGSRGDTAAAGTRGRPRRPRWPVGLGIAASLAVAV